MAMELKKASEYETCTPTEVRVSMALANLDQYEFAEYVGVSPQVLGQWLKGHQGKISHAVSIRISEVAKAFQENAVKQQAPMEEES